MKDRKILYKLLLMALPIFGMASVQAQTFTPSTEPVFSTPRAKPNIHMVLDDSGSMRDRDVASAVDGGNIMRTVALERTVSALFRKYRNKAYLGVSFLWDRDDKNQGLVYLPLGDYSTLDDTKKNKISTIDGWYERVQDYYGRWTNKYIEGKRVYSTQLEDEVLYPLMNKIYAYGGGTPFYRSVYEGIKMFRGQPLNEAKGNNNGYQIVENDRGDVYYNYTKSLSNPVRYRCQQNHMVVMTDGEPNTNSLYGIVKEDKQLYENAKIGQYRDNRNRLRNLSSVISDNVYMNLYYSAGEGDRQNASLATILGEIAANTDLRKYQTGTDKAGKPWVNDIFSTPMPIYMHTVSLFVNPKSNVYTGLTAPLGPYKDKPGLNLGFSDNGSVDDLLAAFDTIFATIIRSTSSASAVNDRTSSALVKNAPSFDAEGNVDINTIGTVRYDTTYDFRSYIGSIRARTSFMNPRTGQSEKVDLWTTDDTIQPKQGRYVTLSSSDYPGKNLALLNSTNTGLTDVQVKWITNFKVNPDEGKLRARLYPLGSITSPDVVIANKDILNINIAENRMSKDFKNDLSNWWLYKAKFQPNNLLVVADNDGMINFVKAQRGLATGSKAGERDTTYFPKMLVPRFNEIAGVNGVSKLVMEGRTNLVDAKVVQPTITGGENIYATIGLTAQGGGGKGFVGYRIFAAPESNVTSKTALSDDNIYEKVTPLFEITDKTEGFGDLGYTYSGFEFFNHTSKGKSQAVAVFGNGFGTDKSVLYFIDAYTGKKLHEIVLDPNGKGAATPSILVSSSVTGGQKIDRIYVGDYSGTLYKVEFAGASFNSSTAKITALFKAPKTNFGQSAISVKPLVVKARNSNLYRVFFGTGLAASYELDRHKNSEVQHSVYSITDYGNKGNDQTYFHCAMASDCTVPMTLKPVLTTVNLKEGKIQYKDNQKLDNKDYESFSEYDLDVTVPYADPNDTNPDRDGWYIRLIADGTASGERVIKDPQYDKQNDAVVFFTWGINERNYKKGSTDDPCLADFIYGKILAFSASSGSFSDGLQGLSNQGKTGRAEGGLTGEWIDNAPDGNGATSLHDIAQEMTEDELKDKVKELVDAVGEGNSALSDDPTIREIGSGVTVKGDTTIQFETSDTSGGVGSSKDITVNPQKKPEGKKPIRLSIQTLLNS